MAKPASRRSAPDKVDVESKKKYDYKRDEIVAVAAKLFSQKGYKSTSLEDIGQEVGLDRATLYYYVKSKKSILDEITQGAARLNTERIEQIAASDASAEVKLSQAYAMQMQSYERHYPSLQIYTQVLLQDMMPIGDGKTSKKKDWGARYYKAMRSILEQGLRDGEFHSELPIGLVTMAVIGAINWSFRWYKPGGPVAARDIGEGFAHLIIDGLKVRRTASAGRDRDGVRRAGSLSPAKQ